MYASVSTQQPAAICALKAPADAIHVLEAVRVGLVPRVTRRLTGHERSLIRAGTVWVWEEEETNMRRWTDGRRWGASRVGGGGFLVYTESSESVSPPPTSHSDGPRSSSSRRPDQLVKQTYSTSMTEASTGKVKKFHVVAYANKRQPQGDAQQPLPLPHQLPLLANLKVVPGIWPEWEQRRDSDGTAGPHKPIHVEALIAPIHGTGSPGMAPSYQYDGSSSYQRPMTGPRSRTPPMAMGHQVNGPAPGQSMDRHHPYSRGRPPPFPGINEYPPRRGSLPAPATAPSSFAPYPPYQDISQPSFRDRPSFPDMQYPSSAPPSGPASVPPPPLPPPPHPYAAGYPQDDRYPDSRYEAYRQGPPTRSPQYYPRAPPVMGTDTGLPVYGNGGGMAGSGAYHGMAGRREQMYQGYSPVDVASPITSTSSRSPRMHNMSALLSPEMSTGQGYAPATLPPPAPPPVLAGGLGGVTLPPLRLALDENQLPPKVVSTTTSPSSHALPLNNYAQTYPPKPNEMLDQYGYTSAVPGVKYERTE